MLKLTLALSLLLSAAPVEWKVIHDKTRAGGAFLVEDTAAVRFLGDERFNPAAPRLVTSWNTGPRRDPRSVVVVEYRSPGQDEVSWKAEHRQLVREVLAAFPRL